MAVLADTRALADSGVGINDSACTDFHIFVNKNKGTDLHGGVNLRLRMDVC